MKTGAHRGREVYPRAGRGRPAAGRIGEAGGREAPYWFTVSSCAPIAAASNHNCHSLDPAQSGPLSPSPPHSPGLRASQMYQINGGAEYCRNQPHTAHRRVGDRRSTPEVHRTTTGFEPKIDPEAEKVSVLGGLQ